MRKTPFLSLDTRHKVCDVFNKRISGESQLEVVAEHIMPAPFVYFIFRYSRKQKRNSLRYSILSLHLTKHTIQTEREQKKNPSSYLSERFG